MYAILDLFKAHFLDLHVFPLPQIILAKFLDVLYVLPKVLLSVKLAHLTTLSAPPLGNAHLTPVLLIALLACLQIPALYAKLDSIWQVAVHLHVLPILQLLLP